MKWMKRVFILSMCLLVACAKQVTQEEVIEVKPSEEVKEEVQTDMIMKINDTKVNVLWETNEAVETLKEEVLKQSIEISMSMYGGFEQVGSLGFKLPSNDSQYTTSTGDIMLYTSNQIVVFYGSNTWAYTKLGKIIDLTDDEITNLLSNGDVTITLEME